MLPIVGDKSETFRQIACSRCAGVLTHRVGLAAGARRGREAYYSRLPLLSLILRGILRTTHHGRRSQSRRGEPPPGISMKQRYSLWHKSEREFYSRRCRQPLRPSLSPSSQSFQRSMPQHLKHASLHQNRNKRLRVRLNLLHQSRSPLRTLGRQNTTPM